MSDPESQTGRLTLRSGSINWPRAAPWVGGPQSDSALQGQHHQWSLRAQPWAMRCSFSMLFLVGRTVNSFCENSQMWGNVRKREKRKIAKSFINKGLAITVESNSYPEPGSNRHALRHWCLRPTRLPIPPSGHVIVAVRWRIAAFCVCKVTCFF